MVIVHREAPSDVAIRFRCKLKSFSKEVIFTLKLSGIELLTGYHL